MLQLLLFLLLLPSILADCPVDSFKYPLTPPSKCYYFMLIPATYTAANQMCKNISANLVSIHDRFTDTFLGDKSETVFNAGVTDFWIGASGTSFTDWVWSDGSPIDYQDWGRYNPSGTCASKRITDGWWNLVDCSQAKPYICEMDEIASTVSPTTPFTPTVTTTSAPLKCPDDWDYFHDTNSCYYRTEEYNWTTAEDYCVQQNAHLASIHSYAELRFIQRTYNDRELWIGLHTNDSKVSWNSNWQWNDGTPLDYSLWNENGMPTTSFGSCASVVYGRFANTMRCSYKNYGVCKKSLSIPIVTPTSPSNTDCPQGWTYFESTNSCYYFKTFNSTTWEAAEEYCNDKNAHLVSIHSKEELNFVKNFAPYYPWIGLSAKTSPVEWNTTWSWSDNTVLDYQKWGYWDMPSLDGNLCVYLSTDGFRNADCEWATSYAVCKTPSNTPTSPASSTSSTPAPVCPAGWKYYGPTNSCFLCSIVGYNWTTAEEYCAFNGGHLASIHNAEEHTFAYSISSNSPWIGLYTKDISVEWNSTWYWIDNSEVDYLPWGDGFPSLDEKLCVFLQGKSFVNYPCSMSMNALCKKSSSIIPTLTPASPTAPVQKSYISF